MSAGPKDYLENTLVDVYSIEQQALAQMRTAPEIAGGERLSQHFREHLIETERQAEMVEERLRAVGGKPSRVKDSIMRLGGKGFLLFARVQPDTPGKLVAHAYSYEALEVAAYELLIRAARSAGDAETERVATVIREQERAMRDRLASDFDEAADASLGSMRGGPSQTLPSYLADAHALESQSIQLLKRGEKMAGSADVGAIYDEHVAESERHARQLEQQMQAIGNGASSLKDNVLRVGGLNWSLFFRALNDTPAKLAAFVYAVEHLEIAGYELLRRVAQKSGNGLLVSACTEILIEERNMADRVLGAFDRAFETSRGR